MEFSICRYVNSFFLTKSLNVKALKCFVWLPSNLRFGAEFIASDEMTSRFFKSPWHAKVHFLWAFVSNIRIKSLEVMFWTNESHTICWISRQYDINLLFWGLVSSFRNRGGLLTWLWLGNRSINVILGLARCERGHHYRGQGWAGREAKIVLKRHRCWKCKEVSHAYQPHRIGMKWC